MISVNKDEVLRYLGYKGGDIPADINSEIDLCIQQIHRSAEPRYFYKTFDVEINENVMLKETNVSLLGNDIKKHLEGCDSVVLMAATIGLNIDNLIRSEGVLNVTKSLILDSCASAAIESVCDSVENMINNDAKKQGKYITWRFSPGYGDMPISHQNDFANLLDTNRKIGLFVSESGILIPRKSVTAVIGIKNTKVNEKPSPCEICNLKENCTYKKEGKSCGK